MKISFTTLACPDWTLAEVIDRGAEAGYDAVDFRGLNGQMGAYVLSEFTDDAEATKKKLSKAGMEISCFSSGSLMYNPASQRRSQSLAELREYRKLCDRFGVQYIRVFGGKIPQGVDRPEAVDEAVATLEEMARMAEPVILAVETHDDWVDSALLGQVMSRLDAPNVGVCWDFHHPYRQNGESARETYDNLGRWVVYTHVKDGKPSGERDSEYVLPGEGGDVPLEEMISLLTSGGYDGYLTLEWEKKWRPGIAEPEIALPAYARYLKQFV